MTDFSFEDILSKNARDTEDPQPLPKGTYLAQIEPPVEMKKVGKDNIDVIEYNLRILQPYDDVVLDSYPKSVIGERRTLRLWVTEKAEYRLKKFFLDTLGLTPKSYRQLIPEAVGHQLAIVINHRESKDGRNYDEIERTAHV